MLMDLEIYDSEDESTYSFTNTADVQNAPNALSIASTRLASEQIQAKAKDSDLGDFLNPDLSLASQTRKVDVSCAKSRPATSYSIRRETLDQSKKDDNCKVCKESAEKLYHVNYDTILKLKESTRKLLCVLEEIQAKTHSKHLIPSDSANFSKLLQPTPQTTELQTVTDILGANVIKRLEDQTKVLDSIYIQDDEDDCSIYKRLTRKCHCLNQGEYNDFVIHFNEDTKYRTSIAGEIVKNMRILKRFLYMNGGYTKNALLFLNEGLSDSAHTEKVEIIQGCAHADMCNIFEDHSIVAMYISWPFKNDYFGDSQTQALTAGFLYKLSQLEEGRRYLNFSSKISNDIKKVLRKKSSQLEFETGETLNAILNLLSPPMAENINVTYYSKPIDEGMGKKTVLALAEYRQSMTLEEIFTHLDLLYHISDRDSGKMELLASLPILIILFKRLVVEFNNSEMNIVVTNILNNIVSKKTVKETEPDMPKTMIIADVATEPIQMKNQTNQVPIKKNNKKINKSKLTLGNLGTSPNKFRNSSRRKVAERQAPRAASVPNWETPPPIGGFGPLVRSRKFSRELRSSIIVVPIEDKIEDDEES